jgi:regulatory protein
MTFNVTSVSAGGIGEIIVSFDVREGEKRSVSRFLISDDAYTKLSLTVGMSDMLTYEAVEREAYIYGAYKRAIYLLGFSASSRRALYKKLVSKGFDPEYSRIALDRLSDNGLLCEADSAIREAEKCASKLWGEERIRAALFEKGYSDESISTAFFALEDSGVDFDENCLSLIKKKYSSLPTDKKELQKIISSLMRYGYSLSQIKRAIALGR